MSRRLSIGVRWALRYTLAMAVTLTVFAVVVHTEVRRRINREARLVTKIHAQELLDSLQTRAREHPMPEVLRWLRERLQRTVDETEPDLGLGCAYLDVHGKPLVRVGSLAGAGLPLPQDLLRGERASSTRAANLGGAYAHLVTVVAAPGGFLEVAVSTRRYARNVADVRDVLLLAFPLMLGLTGVLGWWLARGGLSAIAEISQTARRISGANLRARIPTSVSGDELDQLADTLNAMIDRIEDGVERIRRFNANAAHEIRTPLHAICSELEVTLDKPRGEAEYRRVLGEVLERAQHLSGGVEAMLRLSHSEAGLDPAHTSEASLASILTTLLEFFEPVAMDRGLTLDVGPLPEVEIRGDTAWLRQMFSNLVDNAIKYSESGGRVRVEGRQRGDRVEVTISDTGPGISQSELPRVFERFQRARRDPRRPGFGLGLPIAREIAHAHGGRIDARSALGEGSRFTVVLPVFDPKSAAR